MNLAEIKTVLADIYAQELADGKKRHIVFWYDEEGEFISDIDELNLENVKLIKLTDNNYFTVKYQLEKADTQSNYLVYTGVPKPLGKYNPLLDIVKYSAEFSADKTAVIMRNLGIQDESLCGVIKKYRKFFNNKERYTAFADYKLQNYREDVVDIAILSVLCKLNMPDLEAVMRVLFRGLLEETNTYWEQVQKFGDVNAFWQLMDKYYGFSGPERSLNKLLVSLMVTSLSYSLEENLPSEWVKFLTSKKSDCIVFINHFMNDYRDAGLFNELAQKVERQLRATEYLKTWDLENYLKCDIFPLFDTEIIIKLIGQLLDGIEEYNRYTEIILARRALHWYSSFQHEYEAVYWAIELFKKQHDWGQELEQQSCCDFFQQYCEKYCSADTAYRRFYTAYDAAENKEYLILLKDKVENTYINWYLNELAIKWSLSVADELQNNWPIPGVMQQQDFYKTFVQPHASKGERIFVIISDAFRYESAKEFSELLDKERKGSTEILPMQGVLPSCIQLGMASLLPHQSIELNSKNECLIAGISVSGTENREKILKINSPDAIALQFEAAVSMSRQELRQTVQGKKVIYIYHNTVDARGDNAATEREVFKAVEDAFQELKSLVNALVNDVSASLIYLTADHGFLYRRGHLTEADKLTKEPAAAKEAKRRYFITRQKEMINGTLRVSLDYLLGTECGIYTAVPRGANRFKIHGKGSNYVHGGAMLQEMVIPVVKFKNDRSKSDKNEVKKVAVKLTSISRKITGAITYLDFFQVEKVADKRVPLRLKVYFTDEANNRISNENMIIADSKAGKPEKRTYREKFTLKSMAYDKRKKYYLVLEDEEETAENPYEKITFIIDIP